MSPTTYSHRTTGRPRHWATSTAAAAKTGGGLGTPILIIVLFMLVIFVDQMRGMAGGADPVRVPESVVGTWVSEDPRYAGRTIQVDPALVVIRRGDAEPASIGVVKEVSAWREGRQDVVRVTYHTDSGDYSIELMPQDGGGMRLRNPNEVLWVRR